MLVIKTHTTFDSISYRQLAAQAKEKDKDIETAIESQVSLGMMVELLIQGWNQFIAFFEEGIHCCQFSLSLSQQTLKQSCSQLQEELSSMRSENKQLLKQLEQEQQNGGHKEREMAQLHQQLQLQTHNHQQLVQQVNYHVALPCVSCVMGSYFYCHTWILASNTYAVRISDIKFHCRQISYHKSGNFRCKNIFIVDGGYEN